MLILFHKREWAGQELASLEKLQIAKPRKPAKTI
jgi:hypothetical protein